MDRAGHGILGTVHPTRGVDAVPVCFSWDRAVLAVPVDTVKPKAARELQRTRNLEADPRAVLLCDHWDPGKWDRLWWVRASLVYATLAPATQRRLGLLLAEKYPQYRDQPFAHLLTFRLVDLEGWSGGPSAPGVT